jgi:hypothetical protein
VNSYNLAEQRQEILPQSGKTLLGFSSWPELVEVEEEEEVEEVEEDVDEEEEDEEEVVVLLTPFSLVSDMI